MGHKDQAIRGDADLYEIFRASEKPSSQWLIGAEAEKFGLHRRTGAPLHYNDAEGKGVPAVLEALQDSHGW